MSLMWLFLTVIFILLEAFTYPLICVWFAFGSAGAFIASLITDNSVIQTAVFVTVSVVMLVCLRPAAKRVLKPKGLNTNIDGLVGKEVMITQDVSNVNSQGQGKLNGMVWTVRSADDTEIKKGETAVVEKVEGVKLVVKKERETICRY